MPGLSCIITSDHFTVSYNMFLVAFTVTIMIYQVPCKSELSPNVHMIIDYHFHGLPFGVDLHFCSLQDSLNSFQLSNLTTLVSRKLASSQSLVDEHQIDWRLDNRLLIFLDCSCHEGLLFLRKHSIQMNVNYRWLIYIDSINSLTSILNTSRLELDSDVALITQQPNGDLQLLRPSRIHLKSPLTVGANHSLVNVSYNRRTQPFASWDERKDGFGNFTFNAVVLFLQSKHGHVQDWHLLLNKSVDPGVEVVRRFLAHPIAYLMEMYNFSLNVRVTNDWGTRLANGTYIGAMGYVVNGDGDFGFTVIKLDSIRRQAMEFSIPIIDSRFFWILVQPKSFGNPTSLIVPFTVTAWIAFIALLLILITAVRLTRLTDKQQYQNDSWGGSTLLVMSSVGQNGIDEKATTLSSKVTFLVVSLGTFLFFLYYSVSVLNGLILPSPDSIQNVDDLLASDIALGVEDVVYMRRDFSKNDSLTTRVRHKKPGLVYLSLEEGFKRVRKGHFAFYALDNNLRTAMTSRMSLDEMCQITELPMLKAFSLSFFWRKPSPVGEILNRGFILIRERGILNYLHKYWLAQKPKCRFTLDFVPIKPESMTLAYGVFIVGLFLSLFFVIIEISAARMEKSRFVRPFTL